jgi:hypothetical protein
LIRIRLWLGPLIALRVTAATVRAGGKQIAFGCTLDVASQLEIATFAAEVQKIGGDETAASW